MRGSSRPAATGRAGTGRGPSGRGRARRASPRALRAPAPRGRSPRAWRRRRAARRPAPRSTPTTRPKPPAAPARTPETASSRTTASSRGHAELGRGVQERVGRRLAGEARLASATGPSTTVCEPVGEPRCLQHGGRVGRGGDDARAAGPGRGGGRGAQRAGVRRDAVAREHLVERVVLAVAEPADRDLVGGSSGCPRAARCRGRRGSRGRRRSGACRRRARSSRRRRTARCRRRRRSSARKPLNISDQARMWTSAVGVTTPSRSKSTARWSAQTTAGGASVMPRG